MKRVLYICIGIVSHLNAMEPKFVQVAKCLAVPKLAAKNVTFCSCPACECTTLPKNKSTESKLMALFSKAYPDLPIPEGDTRLEETTTQLE